jgi:transcriptional regulator with XRE-family HTH domain
MEPSQVITLIRKKKGLSQTDFAKLVGLTQASLSYIESNRKKPNQSTIAKICVALEIPELIGEDIKKMIIDAI